MVFQFLSFIFPLTHIFLFEFLFSFFWRSYYFFFWMCKFNLLIHLSSSLIHLMIFPKYKFYSKFLIIIHSFILYYYHCYLIYYWYHHQSEILLFFYFFFFYFINFYLNWIISTSMFNVIFKYSWKFFLLLILRYVKFFLWNLTKY